VQAAFARNLLLVTAERTGFAAARGAPPVGANLPRPGGAGLGAFDAAGRAVVATPDLAPLEGAARAVLDAARGGVAGFALLPLGAEPTLVLAAPIAAIQGDPGATPVGAALGVKDVARELWPLLARPPAPERSAFSLLVRRAGAALEILSPAEAGATPLSRRVALDTPGLAESWAAANPGGFALLRDLRDVEVLVTARAIAGSDWILVHRVDRAEALADSDARRARLLLALCLGAGALALVLVAVWRHGASRRARAAADRAGALARRFEAQGRLLRLVTDSQPAGIFILDGDQRLRFANRRFAETSGIGAGDAIGKTLSAVIGPAAARRREDEARAALATGTLRATIEREERAGATRVVRAEHVPLPPDDGAEAGVLVVEEDVTGVVTERERRERNLHALVDALVGVVDRRDPFAANHSERVAAVAGAVAAAMELEPALAETAAVAGRLMNLGKALVPETMLRRDGKLSDEEKHAIRQALQHGVDLLAGIEFNGPVVETLRQAQERWDGTGPHGLAGEAIPVTARVIAVANAFIAMVSPRAHRRGWASTPRSRRCRARPGPPSTAACWRRSPT
jgi:PAS domain S-box-containing protein